MNTSDEFGQHRTLSDMLSREAILVAEIASMRQQVKVARQKAWVERVQVEPDWLRRVNCALIARKKELAGLRVERVSEQRRLKDARHQLDIDTRISLQAAFMRQAKRLLTKKVYGEIRAAAVQEHACEGAPLD